MKHKKSKTNMRFRFQFIIINSYIFSSLLVGLLTLLVIRSFQLESALELFPILFIGIPLLASGIISLIFTIIASESSLKELNYFIAAIDDVSRGDFSVELDEKSSKVLKPVYRSFNQMVAELNSVQILRNDFISSFSHEFKTPIVSIRGFAKLAKTPNISIQERNEYLDIIISEINRLVNLSNSTLLLTQLESQEIVLEKEDFNLDEQLRQSIVLLQDKWEEKNINFNLDLDNLIINGNKTLLQQLWLNVLDNAIKFSNPGSTITTSLKDYDEKNVLIKIVDQGIGMSEDTVKQIFNKFYQADPSRSSHGIGLGLSIANRIIDLCQGKIEVFSEINKGTSFLISLPKS
ncbi:MAG: HAMP domain-containing histidine kinase [Acholeplasmataceae bacterium]|jgi:signal transduction histidine kinase|nr:HAMP domain-containing histidine kinase [Acholeplasmataceae bacterium]